MSDRSTNRFANDLLLFTRGETRSVELLHTKFNIFSVVSGLEANQSKSVIYYGVVNIDIKREIELAFWIRVKGHCLSNILVYNQPLQNIILDWQPFSEKIVARITSWTTKNYLMLIEFNWCKQWYFRIHASWAQIFIIKAYCISYIWSRINTITKKALVAWDTVCSPTVVRGRTCSTQQSRIRLL